MGRQRYNRQNVVLIDDREIMISTMTRNRIRAIREKNKRDHYNMLAPKRTDINKYIEYVLNSDDQSDKLEQCELNIITQKFITSAFAAGKHPLILLPMGTGKTVQTYTRLAYEIGRDRDLTSMVVTSAYTTAKQRVSTVENILLSNRHREIFPETEPDYKRGWSDATGLYIKRDKIAPDPTVRGTGIIGQYTGARLDYILLDDVVDLDNTILRNTQSYIIDKVKTSLFTRLYKDGHIVVIGTPYTETDLYYDLMTNSRFCYMRCPVATDFSCLEVYSEGLKIKLPKTIPLPYYADESFMRQREAEIGYAAWQRGYRLSPVVSTENWYRNLDTALLAVNPPRPGDDVHGTIIQGIDLAGKSRKGTAIITCIMNETSIHVIDASFIAGGWLERLNTIKSVGDAWGTQLQVVESNAQQIEVIDALRDIGVPWKIIPHATTSNKWDAHTGVEMMDVAFANNELKIMCGHPEYRNESNHNQLVGIMRLIEELRIAPASGRVKIDNHTEVTELDGVMALWFAWRYWAKHIKHYNSTGIIGDTLSPGARVSAPKHSGQVY